MVLIISSRSQTTPTVEKQKKGKKELVTIPSFVDQLVSTVDIPNSGQPYQPTANWIRYLTAFQHLHFYVFLSLKDKFGVNLYLLIVHQYHEKTKTNSVFDLLLLTYFPDVNPTKCLKNIYSLIFLLQILGNVTQTEVNIANRFGTIFSHKIHIWCASNYLRPQDNVCVLSGSNKVEVIVFGQ